MSAIAATVLKRLGLGVVTLFVVTIVISLAVEMLPGDFANSMLGQAATPETVAAFRKDIGLDRPLTVRYFDWISGVARGEFGYSLAGAGSLGGSRRPVADLVEPRLANTLFLAAVTALISVPLALILGMMAALYRNTLFDRIVNIVALTSISSPEFFVGYILMLFLAIKLPIFHSLANVSADTPFFERLGRIALPSLTLLLTCVDSALAKKKPPSHPINPLPSLSRRTSFPYCRKTARAVIGRDRLPRCRC